MRADIEADCLYIKHPDAPTLSQAVKKWSQENGKIPMLALVAEQDRAAIPILQKACTESGVRLYGAMFSGLIVNGRVVEQGMNLVPLQEETRGYLSKPLEEEGALDDMIAWLDSQKGKDQTLFLVFDAMVPNVATILEDIYGKLGCRYKYGGVNAGSKTLKQQPCLVKDDRFTGGGILALLLPVSTGAMLEHGYPEPEQGWLATSIEGNLIHFLDWQPALAAYQKLIEKKHGVKVTEENFYKYSVHYPFGIIRANGEILVRIPSKFNSEGGIFCIGEVPPNSILKVLDTSDEILLDGVRRLAGRLREKNWNRTLIFYCVGRRMHLGEKGCLRELETLAEAVGPCFGAMSLGEIGTTAHDQYPLFHNASIVALLYSS